MALMALRSPPSLEQPEDANCSPLLKKENELFDHLSEKQSLTRQERAPSTTTATSKWREELEIAFY